MDGRVFEDFTIEVPWAAIMAFAQAIAFIPSAVAVQLLPDLVYLESGKGADPCFLLPRAVPTDEITRLGMGPLKGYAEANLDRIQWNSRSGALVVAAKVESDRWLLQYVGPVGGTHYRAARDVAHIATKAPAAEVVAR